MNYGDYIAISYRTQLRAKLAQHMADSENHGSIIEDSLFKLKSIKTQSDIDKLDDGMYACMYVCMYVCMYLYL